MSEPLPLFEDVRDEANTALREVVAEFPTAAPVEQLGEDSLGCGGTGVPSGSSGVTYTNHIAVVQSETFDGAAFIEALPDRLGDAYVARESEIKLNTPSIDVVARDHGGSLFSVSAREHEGEKFLEVYVFSRCGQQSVDRAAR